VAREDGWVAFLASDVFDADWLKINRLFWSQFSRREKRARSIYERRERLTF
jgi:hypothetical protein